MSIRIRCKNGATFRGKVHFLPLLQLIEKYPFPQRLNCLRTNHKLKWLDTKITSFTEDKFLKYLDPIRRAGMYIIHVDDTSDNHLHLTIGQNEDSILLMSNVSSFISIQQSKQLFIELIQGSPLWSEGHYTSGISNLLRKNFPNEDSDDRTMLTWLQYFGKEELEKRGGYAAFESNPYVQTQRIHDGLLVQVGESPDVFETPEGEQLLVRAIHALPLIKH